MAIRSLGNPIAKYNAVWGYTGVGAVNRPGWIEPYGGTGSWVGNRALSGGGTQSGGNTNEIDYIDKFKYVFFISRIYI